MALGRLVPHGVVAPALPVPVPLVGSIPLLLGNGGIFPTTHNQVMELGDQDILNLMVWYNDTMGISDQDNLTTRRSKVMQWLM